MFTYLGEDNEDSIVAVLKANSEYDDAIVVLDDADTCNSKRVINALGEFHGMKIIVLKYAYDFEEVAHNTVGYYTVRFKDNTIVIRSRRCEI